MWLFGKNKKNSNKENKDSKELIDECNKFSNEDLLQEAEDLKINLRSLPEDERVNTLNKIGEIYYKLKDYDSALKYYEESLGIEKALGKAYTNLLNIYNIKRKEAALNKDDDMIQYYLVKIDEMMKISKDVVRGNV